jgi:hypothetical protein
MARPPWHSHSHGFTLVPRLPRRSAPSLRSWGPPLFIIKEDVNQLIINYISGLPKKIPFLHSFPPLLACSRLPQNPYYSLDSSTTFHFLPKYIFIRLL